MAVMSRKKTDGEKGSFIAPGRVDVLGVEVGVRETRGEPDAEPDVDLVARAADDPHRTRVSRRSAAWLPSRSVMRPVRQTGVQRRLGAQPEAVEQVRPQRAREPDGEVGRQRPHHADAVAARR